MCAAIAERFCAALLGLVHSKHIRGLVLHTLEAMVVLGGRPFLASWGQAIVTSVEQCLPQLQQTDERDLRAVAQLVDAMVATTATAIHACARCVQHQPKLPLSWQTSCARYRW